MANQTGEVDRFIAKLEHPLKKVIQETRSIIMGSDEQITEHIKWNAPSFCYRDEDKVTLKLYPTDRVQLIFHRGAKVKDSKDFEFTDDTGLLEWVAGDRALVTLHDMEDVEAKKSALIKVVSRWMKANS